MIVEIRGAGFVNKGAELMLLAILNILRTKTKVDKIVMAPNLVDCPYEKIAHFGMYQKIWLESG
ncbi:hypothetical protein THIOM_004121 [Candidatus Thiomargarita nelsonii]|uniref:Uncharacterized protein n=1 Tax=Candidatus Thiomargarita nelsonii TaxID=1003181 RepID=A0A0A6RHW5_9GAMM|nr:hypothetical protein THIOM_004121 [Candidatus Thiomargarita nelsonii]